MSDALSGKPSQFIYCPLLTMQLDEDELNFSNRNLKWLGHIAARCCDRVADAVEGLLTHKNDFDGIVLTMDFMVRQPGLGIASRKPGEAWINGRRVDATPNDADARALVTALDHQRRISTDTLLKADALTPPEGAPIWCDEVPISGLRTLGVRITVPRGEDGRAHTLYGLVTCSKFEIRLEEGIGDDIIEKAGIRWLYSV